MPFSDSAPCDRWPILVTLLSAVLIATYVLQLDAAEHRGLLADLALEPSSLRDAWRRLRAQPGLVFEDPGLLFREVLRPLSGASLLSAGPIHLGASVLYLFVFGDNVEGRLGRVRFVLLWLVGAFVAGGVHVWLSTEQSLPVVGASGAVAALLGAYALLFRRARMRFVRYVEFPCLFALVAFFALQFRPVQTALGWVGVLDGLEIRAHFAGFAVGAVLGPLLCIGNPRREPRKRSKR